jgi:hypothetical protein
MGMTYGNGVVAKKDEPRRVIRNPDDFLACCSTQEEDRQTVLLLQEWLKGFIATRGKNADWTSTGWHANYFRAGISCKTFIKLERRIFMDIWTGIALEKFAWTNVMEVNC